MTLTSIWKGLHLIAPIQRELYRRGIEHRFIFVGDGPMARELRAAFCAELLYRRRLTTGGRP